MSVEINGMMLNVYQYVNESGILHYSVDFRVEKGKLKEFRFNFEFDVEPRIQVSVGWTKDVDYEDFKSACLESGAFQLQQIKKHKR